MEELLRSTNRGLYCEAGDFYVDPWKPVDRAVVTHAHSDHARPGSRAYLAARSGEAVLRARLGTEANIEWVEYGERRTLGRATVSLHPAGHILGSAQVRIERAGEVWVVSGDYKGVHDPTCAPLEPLRCHTFVTESTFGLPIYRWPAPADVVRAIEQWRQAARAAGRACLLYAYSLGKAQRILAALDPTAGPIYTHGAIEAMNQCYRSAGVKLPETIRVVDLPKGTEFDGALVLAPPAARDSAWARKFGPASTAFASGWMQIRGRRRQRSVDRGFVLSDHADWPTLLEVVAETGAERILATHGYVDPLVAWLREQGWNAGPLAAQFEGELEAEQGTVEAVS